MILGRNKVSDDPQDRARNKVRDDPQDSFSCYIPQIS